MDIYQASEGQYMFYTMLPSIYSDWGYDLIAGVSIDDGLLDLFTQVRKDHQLGALRGQTYLRLCHLLFMTERALVSQLPAARGGSPHHPAAVCAN